LDATDDLLLQEVARVRNRVLVRLRQVVVTNHTWVAVTSLGTIMRVRLTGYQICLLHRARTSGTSNAVFNHATGRRWYGGTDAPIAVAITVCWLPSYLTKVVKAFR
jgi:hypothetical protein